MQQIKSKPGAIRSMLFIMLCTLLFSFKGTFGGDSFEIYLNNKLVFQQFVSLKEGIKTFQLDQSSYNDQVNIYYSHCGKTGKARTIAIKDEQNNLLKEWHFNDAADNSQSMSCRAKELLDFQKKGVSQINLYYSSKELPAGKLLATITLASDKKAAR